MTMSEQEKKAKKKAYGKARRATPQYKKRIAEYRLKHKDKIRKQQSYNYHNKYKHEIAKIRKYIDSFKEAGCLHCGYNKHPCAIDFHHRDPKTKVYLLSQISMHTKDIDIIKREIDKCDVLCANCHRILHYNERIKQTEETK